MKSTACFGMWVAQALFSPCKMTPYFSTVTSAMLNFLHVRGAFFCKIASKCLSNILCICKMTFPHLTARNQYSTSERHTVLRETIHRLFILGLKHLIFFFVFMHFIFNHRLSSWVLYIMSTLYYLVSSIYHLLKFRWETPETFWLFRNILLVF